VAERQAAPATVEKTTTASSSKQAYLEFKELSKRRNKIKKQIQSTRSRIEDHERRLKQLETDLNENIPKSDWEKLQTVSAEKDEVENRILELYAELEQLEAEPLD